MRFVSDLDRHRHVHQVDARAELHVHIHELRRLEPRRVVEPAAATGLALRNLAPKPRSIAERYIGNRRKNRCLARDWPAP